VRDLEPVRAVGLFDVHVQLSSDGRRQRRSTRLPRNFAGDLKVKSRFVDDLDSFAQAQGIQHEIQQLIPDIIERFSI
jgi:hypothetical protein